MGVTAKVSAQIVTPLFGALMAYGVSDMNAQNIAHDQQGAPQPQGSDRPSQRHGPLQKDKIDTGRTVVGGPPVLPPPADCATAWAATPAPSAMVQSSSGGEGPKGASGSDHDGRRANPINSNTPSQRHRGGPRGGGRDKILVGRAAPAGAQVLPPCTPAAAPSATTP